MRQMDSVITGIFFPQMGSKCYTLTEKINYWLGKSFMFHKSAEMKEMNAADLRQDVKSLEIPVYFISGVYDYTCPYPLSKEYFDALKAETKGFYSFTDSAHSPLWEEPEKMMKILINDVLKGTVNLADQ